MIANFVLAGQSNLDQWFVAGGGAVLEVFKQTFLALNPQYTDVQFFDAARGGSAMLSGSASQYADVRAPDDPVLHDRISENYWYDETTGTAGPNLTLFTDRLLAEVASGTEFLGVIWAQGEADTTYVGENGADEYAEGLAYVLNQLMEASGAQRTYIQALGDRAFYSESLHGGTEAIRAAQQAVADGNDAITLATTIFDLDLRDSVHLTDAAYETAAQRMAIAISSGETSPAVGQTYLVDASTILVQMDLSTVQSISATFGLGGFSLTEGGVEIGISSVTMTDAGLIRIVSETAMSSPTIYYAAARDSVAMQPEDVIYVTGPNGSVPILPFEMTLSAPRVAIWEVAGGLVLESGPLSEQITGLSGDDVLYGNDGHDTLVGGWGNDTYFGGSGSDVFVMGEDGDLDVVRDFDVSRDAIGLSGFSQAGMSFFDQAGAGLEVVASNGQRILLEGLGLADADDVLFHMLGTDGANDLVGHDGNDRIFAFAGDDMIDSGAGYDRITTGDGSDIVTFGAGYGTNIVYDFDVTNDSIQLANLQAASLTIRDYKGTDLELRTEGGDRLILRDVALSESGLVEIVDAPRTVGFVTGTEGNDVLSGTALDELITAFGGTDRLYGGGGSDVFVFQAGFGLNVVYDFVDGQDRILVDPADFATLAILPYKDTDAEIRLASGDRLVLRDIDVGAIGAEDFIFAIPEEFG